MRNAMLRTGLSGSRCSRAWAFARPPNGWKRTQAQPAATATPVDSHSGLQRYSAVADDAVHKERVSDSASVSFFATCHPGLEQVVVRELQELGYRGVEPSKAGVAFRGSCLADGYAANMWLRSAIRVLVLLAEGDLGADPREGKRGGQALYEMVYDAAPWSELIPSGRTFSVEPRLWSCTDLSSTKLVWSRVKDAVCDSIKQHRPGGKPPPPQRGEVADVPLYVSCYRDTIRIFRDMSGESLHRRGYRDVMHRAALNEAAAAGALVLAGWPEVLREAGDGDGLVLADPMCGSGTLLIEAALMARDIAPGLMRSLEFETEPSAPTAAAASMGRKGRQDGSSSGDGAGRGIGRGSGRLGAPVAVDAWPFQRWPDYDETAWRDAVEAARERVRPPWKGRLLGIDVHEGALSLAERQARKAGVLKMIELTHGDCGSVTPEAVPQLVVANPPWGSRLGGEGGSGPADAYDLHVDDAGPSSYGRRRNRDGGSGPSDASSADWANAGEGDEAFLAAAWRSLDGFLYRQCPGANATILSGNRSAFRYLKLKPTAKHNLVLSGVDVQVASYRIRDAASRTLVSTTERPSDVEPFKAADYGPAPAATITPAAAGPSNLQYEDGSQPPAGSSTVPAAGRRSHTRPAGRGLGNGAGKHRAAHADPVLAPARGGAAATSRAAVAAKPPPLAADSNAYDDYWVSD